MLRPRPSLSLGALLLQVCVYVIYVAQMHKKPLKYIVDRVKCYYNFII